MLDANKMAQECPGSWRDGRGGWDDPGLHPEQQPGLGHRGVMAGIGHKGAAVTAAKSQQL